MSTNSRVGMAGTSDGYLVSLSGRGTLQESPSFQQLVAGCLKRRQSVTVDLSDCDYLDSTFLGCFIGLHKLSERIEGACLRIYADQQRRIRLFSTSLLDRLLEFVESPPYATSASVPLEMEQHDPGELGRHVLRAHRLLAEMGGDDADRFQSIADQLQRELTEPHEQDASERFRI